MYVHIHTEHLYNWTATSLAISFNEQNYAKLDTIRLLSIFIWVLIEMYTNLYKFYVDGIHNFSLLCAYYN